MTAQAMLQRVRSGKPILPSGFSLANPASHQFGTVKDFQKALKKQRHGVVALPNTILDADGLKLNGSVEGTPYRFTSDGFADLCTKSRVPVQFIRRLACVAPAMAIDVMKTAMSEWFFPEALDLIVDSESKLIFGVVGRDSYTHCPNENVFQTAISCQAGLKFQNGWLSGPLMRADLLSPAMDFEPRKGDVMQVGASVVSGISGDRAIQASAFLWRLACLNGLRAWERDANLYVMHVGDVVKKMTQHFVRIFERTPIYIEEIKKAARQKIDANTLSRIKTFLLDPKQGGSTKMTDSIVYGAGKEADEGGVGFLSLFDVMNGVTAYAQKLKTLQGRARIEELGYTVIQKFLEN